MGSANRPGNLFIPSGKADKITSPLMNFVDNYFEVLHCHLLTPFMASLLILLLFKLQTIDPEQHNNHFLPSHKSFHLKYMICSS